MNTLTPESEDVIVKSYKKRKLSRLKDRRNKRKLKIFFARFRIIARLASYVFIIWVIFQISTLPFWYLNENIFASYPNKQLEFEGNNIISTKQIMKKLQEISLPDKPLYLIDTTSIEKKLEEMPPVKKVFIRRYWLPARLKIVIDERTPVLSIAPNHKVEPIAALTLDFYKVQILEKQYLPLPEGLKTYKIITYDDYSAWKPSLTSYLHNLAQYLENAAGDKLIYLDIRNPDDVYAQMKNVRLRIGGIKGREIFDRIQKVNSVIPEAMKIKNNINYIDLRWNNASIKLQKSE